MNVDDEIVMCVCVCVCVSVVGRSLVCVLVHVAVADLRRLLSNVGSGLQRLMLQHIATPTTIATAMASSAMNKRHIRAFGDELSEKIEFDKAALLELDTNDANARRVIQDRIAQHQQELRELFGRPLQSDDDNTASTTTLQVNKGRIAVVRSVGVQTE